jgi:uncharacterized protein (TIGR04255 family)
MNSAPLPPVPKPPYRNAPIIEAIIELQVHFADPGAARVARADFVASLSNDFPRQETMHRHDFKFEVQPGADPRISSEQGPGGWRMLNAKSDRILILLHDTFTYSHMPPYTEWATFRAECEPLWKKYTAKCKPDRVSRLAVRNINRLKFPRGDVDLDNYLQIVPDVPSTIGVVNSLLFQIQVAQPSIGPTAQSFVRLATDPVTDPESQSFVLDIGVSLEGSWSPDEAAVWEQLTRLRDKKDELFEASITDATRRLFA